MPEVQVPFTISRVTHRDMVGGGIALIVVSALTYAALIERSAAAETSLVSALGAIIGWLYRSEKSTIPNGSNESGGSGGNTGSKVVIDTHADE